MRRTTIIIPLLAVLTLAAIVICPLIGIVTIKPGALFTNDTSSFVYWSMRFPRMVVALMAGGGLAVSGMIYQAIFRNPLADPYTLGVSSGASLGAALCILIGAGGSAFGLSFIAAGAFAGALGSILVINAFSWSRDANSSTLLLAGVVVATLCSGLIMFVHFICGFHESFQIIRWIMGGVDGVDGQMALVMTPPLVVFLGVVWILMAQLDQFPTGDDIAHSRGVNVRRSRNFFITSTALAVGIIVAICGPIGFIGIIAPHACRMMMPGIRHRALALSSFLLGGCFLIIADTLARSLVKPLEIPVGIITALLGGPFFLILLFRRKNKLLL
jgi:iron complex transport system permease protein